MHLSLAQTKPGEVFKDCDDCPEMVVIPSGSFLFGSPPEPEQDPFSNKRVESIGEDNERPQILVNIKSFAIGKFEITQEQWYSVMGFNPGLPKGRTLPVTNVSWDAVQLFIQKLNQKTGKKYRLPSETEWEYSLRAGTTSIYPFKDTLTKTFIDNAWFRYNSRALLYPVGLKKPNQFGLHDMLGNVWEWVQDCAYKNHEGAPTDGSSRDAKNCKNRILRGGFYNSYPWDLRSAKNDFDLQSSGHSVAGFRLAKDLP
ncbi:MAG: formylglycine-generating enzyme family protein [Sulfuritalea sp.]|nr:formylglycine-generating enzyme family protein [Sulfuritalea sp.]